MFSGRRGILILLALLPATAGCSHRYLAPVMHRSPRSTGGPLIVSAHEPAPGSPAIGHTTIAPFPVPADTSRETAERVKTMNLPRAGMTTIAPMPPPGTASGETGFRPDPGQLPESQPPGRVDLLPEVTLRFPPEYPEAALRAGIQGTVSVMALVLADGTVGETRVVKSIPALDAAAVAAVKQFRFTPAAAAGKPVAVWTGIPVKFTLH